MNPEFFFYVFFDVQHLSPTFDHTMVVLFEIIYNRLQVCLILNKWDKYFVDLFLNILCMFVAYK